MEISTPHEYGKQMNTALRAVLQMHADSSKLLLDIDAELVDYISLFDYIATANLSYDVKTRRYMAQALFRHYVREKLDTEVIAVNILFVDVNRKTYFDEPLFVVAKLSYEATTGSNAERQARFWHPWAALFDWSQGEGLLKATEICNVKDVQKAVVRALPLFEITSIQAAMKVIAEVAPELNAARTVE